MSKTLIILFITFSLVFEQVLSNFGSCMQFITTSHLFAIFTLNIIFFYFHSVKITARADVTFIQWIRNARLKM